MNIEQLKNESKSTYVYVHVHIHGIHKLRSYATHGFSYDLSRLNYCGTISVPFCYEDFISLNVYQQKAVCEAEFLKSGICLQVRECNPDIFYSE